MALLIKSSDCINCELCEPECPNEAISPGEQSYVIDPDKCTECVGYFEKSRCVQVCPIDCIVLDPEHQESKDQLKEKFLRHTTSAA
jgi:ferredoxin